jgi:hypothetical protein
MWPERQAVRHHEEVIAMTATQQQRQRSWRLMAAMHRTARTLRYVNDELMRANEAIFRPAGAPPPGPPVTASASSAASVTGDAATDHAGRAA